MFFKTYWLLGQNARNLNYIKEYNTKFAKKLADSKLKTKDFLRANNIAIPKTIDILIEHQQLNNNIFDKLEPPFVVKPNGGFWGKWILVFDKKTSDWNYITNDNQRFSTKELLLHFSNILDWFYSLSWNRDKVMIERKIELDEEIELLGTFWLPDIRIITFNMVPVMAMLRVPTKQSKWKANLHAWACWVWIDIWTWKLTFITLKGKIVKSIPGIWDVRWLKLPKWDIALALAVKVQQVTKIWYVGCDIVLDKRDWPLILEINIRPGLEVQVANMAPLKDRLEKVEWIFVNSVEKWVRLGRDLFSWDIEEKIKNITWKKVVWTKEYLHFNYNEKKYKYLADIKPSNTKSYIDRDFAIDVLKLEENNINKWVVKFEILLLGEVKKTKFIIKELWNVNILLWLNALKWFLIDPFKYKKWELPVWNENIESGKNTAIKKNYEKLVKKIDEELLFIDKKLLILKAITPLNLKEEKIKFIESGWEYIPEFKYNEFKYDLEDLEDKLKKIEISDIPLASIYKRKKDEISNKINFLKAFQNKQYKDFTKYSKAIYGDIVWDNLDYIQNILDNKEKTKQEDEYLEFEEIHDLIKKFNHIYNINISLRRWQKAARFVMKWDILYIREGAKVWKKELRSIVAHEIEWHYLRKLNWKKLDYNIFWHWTAWYLETDEWIAVYNQNRFLSNLDRKYYWIFERYYFTYFALNNSYSDLLEKMKEYYDWDLEKIFNYITRFKRWMTNFTDDWVFVKDIVYVNWLLKINEFIKKWWKLEELYIGKISLEDLEEVKNSYFIKFNFKWLITPFFIKYK